MLLKMTDLPPTLSPGVWGQTIAWGLQGLEGGCSVETIYIKDKKPLEPDGGGGGAFDPSTREAEAGGSLSSKPAWSTE